MIQYLVTGAMDYQELETLKASVEKKELTCIVCEEEYFKVTDYASFWCAGCDSISPNPFDKRLLDYKKQEAYDGGVLPVPPSSWPSEELARDDMGGVN